MSTPLPVDSPERTLRELVGILFLRKRLILSTFLGVIAVAVFLFFYFLSPTYEVKSTLLIDTSDLVIPIVDGPPVSDLDKMTNFHTL
jgi:uncharacterized protein involved in exopolysaccharide biosynthesis